MQRLLVIVTCLLLTGTSMAAGKRAGRTAASTTTDAVTNSASSDTLLNFGSVLPMLPDTGETGFGFSFGFLTQTEATKKLYVGADLGLHFWGKFEALGNGSESVTGLQFLPTAIYTFGNSTSFVPYFGLSAGPYLLFNTVKVDAPKETSSTLVFMLAFRPGLNWNFGKKVGLNAEAKFGQLGPFFIVIPSVGLNIPL
jgi:hypothetical protein